MRPSGRAADELRPISLEPGFAKYAEGSCMARFGDTHVLCAATVEERVPPFLNNSGAGWVTAEYGMLPRPTHSRPHREAARGRQGPRGRLSLPLGQAHWINVVPGVGLATVGVDDQQLTTLGNHNSRHRRLEQVSRGRDRAVQAGPDRIVPVPVLIDSV